MATDQKVGGSNPLAHALKGLYTEGSVYSFFVRRTFRVQFLCTDPFWYSFCAQILSDTAFLIQLFVHGSAYGNRLLPQYADRAALRGRIFLPGRGRKNSVTLARESSLLPRKKAQKMLYLHRRFVVK